MGTSGVLFCPAVGGMLLSLLTLDHVARSAMSPKPVTTNIFFHGDNLPILREYLPDECVDLIYLDIRI